MNVDKSNTLYYDVVIKWLNIYYYSSNIDKAHTLYYNVVTKWSNIITSTVNLPIVVSKLPVAYYYNTHTTIKFTKLNRGSNQTRIARVIKVYCMLPVYYYYYYY